jgi:hypothetical protein
MFTEDLTAFFNTDEHAETATIGGTPVKGIFDEPARNEVGIGATHPSFMCATADLPAGFETAVIVLRGRNFKLASEDVDETGGVMTLALHEQ